MKYARLATVPVPQTEPLNERQTKNNAGGFVFQLDDWKRLDRFLILGADAPTYYQKAPELTRQNAACVERCYALDAARTVGVIVEISDTGRAPKNDPAIFALAIGAASVDVKTRQLALGAVPKVCRTGTHLFQFVTAVRALGRGWGRSLKRAIGNWYDHRSPQSVAYQVIKYRSRENFTHKRMLQSAHPPGMEKSPDRVALYRWICEKEYDAAALPPIVSAHIAAMASTNVKEWVRLAAEHDLPWEALPTAANAKAEVWQALLPKMGLTALVRNLGNMSRLEAIKPLSKFEKIAVERLGNRDDLRKSRLHPFNILQAQAVYNSGHGMRGSGTWTVSQPIVAALEDAFYASFDNVVPTGKRTFIGLDVSGSMSSPFGGSALTVAEAAAAVAMVTVRTEPWCMVMGFASTFRDLKITAKDSLRDVLKKTTDQNFGSTDCSLPMLYATEKGLDVDTFIVATDNETYAGRVHPSIALQAYRNKSGINAKLIVIGMTATQFTIADPTDGGMLDVVGFDSAAPAVMADFARQ